MIQITPHMRILVAVQPVDFRKGIDGLAALCRQALESDPLAGTLFESPNDCTRPEQRQTPVSRYSPFSSFPRTDVRAG